MRCVILQPSYLPWRGYFDQIRRADVFVFLDDVQYDKGGWRNRNRFKSSQGTHWLTVPVLSKGTRQGLQIRDVRINWDRAWNDKHLRALTTDYAKAPFLDRYYPMLESTIGRHYELLADLAIDTTTAIAGALGISGTRFVRSSELGVGGAKADHVVALLRELGATHYISGPSAADYLDPESFDRLGISLEYMQYDYPVYDQLHPPFDPHVSVVDLLLMKGPEASSFIW
jgi:hypothetical protein